MVVFACNPRTWGMEAAGFQISGQPELHRDTPSQIFQKEKKTLCVCTRTHALSLLHTCVHVLTHISMCRGQRLSQCPVFSRLCCSPPDFFEIKSPSETGDHCCFVS